MREIDPTLPARVRELLARGDPIVPIRLDRDGTWWHEGEAFTNPKIIALFNRSVGLTEGGTWIVRIGPFTHPIEVELTGWFVERVDLAAAPPRVFLSDGNDEPLDPSGLRYDGDGVLLCRIHGGEHRARFKRSAYYELSTALDEKDGEYLLRVGDQTVWIATEG